MATTLNWQHFGKGLLGTLLVSVILAACSTTAPDAPSTPDLGVVVTNLESGDQVDFSTITVSCEIGSAVTQASYSLNGGEPIPMTFTSRNYDFSVEGLIPGMNTIEIIVDDDNPSTASVTIIIEVDFGGDSGKDRDFIALTDHNTLLTFSSDDPDDTTGVALMGVKGTLLGIDYRPANGLLYGLDTTNTLYTIDPETGAAKEGKTLNVAFRGGSFSGFDFNPMADRLRITGLNDQNFRVNVDTGEVTVDGTLAFRDGDKNEGASPTVTASAYRNSVANANTTALYGLDAKRNVLVLQDPPNDGTLSTIGRRDLGFNVDEVAGFDIVTDSSSNYGRYHTSDMAYALSENRLYALGLTSGQSKFLAKLPRDTYIGLTVVIDAPEQQDDTPRDMVALGSYNTLAFFNSGKPDEVEKLRVRGVRGTLLAIDYRPATGVLYGLSSSDRVYTIDTQTGRATEARRLNLRFTGGSRSGFDFNPMADRLRLTNSREQNLRLNVDTNEDVLVDGPLRYAVGDANEGKNPAITASAYTNAFAMAPATELYGIDADLDVLVEQDPPNDGVLVTDGELGVDVGSEAGFDIVTDDPQDEGSNVAYLLSKGGLYKVDLDTGAATSIGSVSGSDYRGLAVVPAGY